MVGGHLGSELTNKAETSISVVKDEKDPDISIVHSEYSRGRDFKDFVFTVDENEAPVILDYMLPSKGASSKSPYRYDQKQRFNIAKEAFKPGNISSYQEAFKSIKLTCEKYNITIGDNIAKDWLQCFKIDGFITNKNGEYKFK